MTAVAATSTAGAATAAAHHDGIKTEGISWKVIQLLLLAKHYCFENVLFKLLLCNAVPFHTQLIMYYVSFLCFYFSFVKQGTVGVFYKKKVKFMRDLGYFKLAVDFNDIM